MTRWHSLYLLSDDSANIAKKIEAHLATVGFLLYSPFGRFPGMTYPTTLKTFVAPAHANWVRVLLDCAPQDAESLAQALSTKMTCLSTSLDGRIAKVRLYQGCKRQDNIAQTLQPYAIKDCNLNAIIDTGLYDLPPVDAVQIGNVTINDLPDDLQHMAGDVSGRRANNLFKQLSKRFLKTVGLFDARTLLDHQADWNSQGGQFLRALIGCLIPDDAWRTPDFATLRSAYSLQTRLQFDPSTALLPGDGQSLTAIPNALDYIPVYGGRSE